MYLRTDRVSHSQILMLKFPKKIGCTGKQAISPHLRRLASSIGGFHRDFPGLVAHEPFEDRTMGLTLLTFGLSIT